MSEFDETQELAIRDDEADRMAGHINYMAEVEAGMGASDFAARLRVIACLLGTHHVHRGTLSPEQIAAAARDVARRVERELARTG